MRVWIVVDILIESEKQEKKAQSYGLRSGGDKIDMCVNIWEYFTVRVVVFCSVTI